MEGNQKTPVTASLGPKNFITVGVSYNSQAVQVKLNRLLLYLASFVVFELN